jgi:Mrp family chromosome partitioning ATPase
LADLRVAYEVVLVDCAPILPVTDPMVASRFADGILLVGRPGSTTRDHARAAQAACAKAGAKVFGAVLNATLVAEGDQSTYYAYYGNSGQLKPEAGHDLSVGPVAGNGASPPTAVETGRAARHRRIRSGIH